jgi:hypothetical protein
MTPPPQPRQNDLVILERIQVLQNTAKDTNEVVKALDAKLDKFELDYTGAHQDLVGSVLETKRRLDCHDTDFEKLNKAITDLTEKIAPMIFTQKIVTWAAAIVGVEVITGIGALIVYIVKVALKLV